MDLLRLWFVLALATHNAGPGRLPPAHVGCCDSIHISTPAPNSDRTIFEEKPPWLPYCDDAGGCDDKEADARSGRAPGIAGASLAGAPPSKR